MSISSFSSRANRRENNNPYYIKSFRINDDDEYNLSKGINAIIGDNGAGKSLLLGILSGTSEKYYDSVLKINTINKMDSNGLQESRIKTIKQDTIVEQVRTGNLFKGDNKYFNNIDSNADFSNEINEYFDNLCEFVNNNIAIEEKRKILENIKLHIQVIDSNFYYPIIHAKLTLEDYSEDEKRKKVLINIYKSLSKEINTGADYYSNISALDDLKEVRDTLRSVLKNVINQIHCKKTRNKVRGIITNRLDDANSNFSSQRTSEENERKEYIAEKEQMKSNIVDYIKAKMNPKYFPEFPMAREGISISQYKGYEFKKIAAYNNVYLKDDFYKYCFTKKYSNENAIKMIKTKDEFSNALLRGSFDELQDFKDDKVKKFIDNQLKEETHISEISSSTSIGNTPGEISLVFYKFQIRESANEYDVLMIDQPEDDINPVKINEFLLAYLKENRDKKQIIIVTHNPLLVVNLDVDNVIYLEKDGDKIKALSGPLEYECDNYKILDLVMKNLDGGYDAIERRLKVYDKGDAKVKD